MEAISGSYFIKNDKLLNADEYNPAFMEDSYSLYEVFRIISGLPLFIDEHLVRLERSAQITNREFGIDRQEVKQRIDRLIKACGFTSGNVKIVLNYNIQANSSMDFYVFFIPHHYPSAQDYLNGVDTISYHARRINPNAKVANFPFNSRVQAEIQRQNVYEALLLDEEGYITEGSRSNIFIVQKNNIFTAELQNVLPGITRSFVIRACTELGYQVAERNINIDDLPEMDAIFLTGTSPNVLPIKRVDKLGFQSAVNPVVRKVMHSYDNLVEEYIRKYP